MNKKKELLFSLTGKDFEFETFKGTGAGGQHRNKTESCVRCHHRPSNSVGSCCEFREQRKNKEVAFKRCAETSSFKGWLRLEIAKRSSDGYEDDPMNEKNFLVEVRRDGKWVPETVPEKESL